MSESSERKLLRKTLAKLKSKTMDSEERYVDNANFAVQKLYDFESLFGKALDSKRKSPETLPEVMDQLRVVLSTVIGFVGNYVKESLTMLQDLHLYISSLEDYSSELDNTLKRIFDAAKEQMEKLEAEMKKAAEKEPEYIE